MVRVIGPDSGQLGVMAVSDALRMAREMDLDLVEVAPTSRPPVCRIMDFGKYRYEQAKREQKAKRKQHLSVVKEVKLRPKIEEHDFEFKMKHARQFLEERDKVKISVLFRGRELSHPELGYALIENVVQTLGDVATVEQKPSQEGRMLVMMLAPRPGVAAKPKSAPDRPAGESPQKAEAPGAPPKAKEEAETTPSRGAPSGMS
jgi:translation initiation factor IF-3